MTGQTLAQPPRLTAAPPVQGTAIAWKRILLATGASVAVLGFGGYFAWSGIKSAFTPTQQQRSMESPPPLQNAQDPRSWGDQGQTVAVDPRNAPGGGRLDRPAENKPAAKTAAGEKHKLDCNSPINEWEFNHCLTLKARFSNPGETKVIHGEDYDYKVRADPQEDADKKAGIVTANNADPMDPHPQGTLDQADGIQIRWDNKMQSDRPGNIVGIVINDVYDRRNPRCLIFPHGTHAFGRTAASSNPRGDATIAGNVLGFIRDRRGSSETFEVNEQVENAAGMGGMDGDVDRHIAGKAGLVALATGSTLLDTAISPSHGFGIALNSGANPIERWANQALDQPDVVTIKRPLDMTVLLSHPIRASCY